MNNSSTPSQVTIDDSDLSPIHAQYDWNDTRPSTAITESLAASLNQNPLDLEPLYDAIDPDAVDELLTTTVGQNLRVTFEHGGVEITAAGTGLLTVLPEGST